MLFKSDSFNNFSIYEHLENLYSETIEDNHDLNVKIKLDLWVKKFEVSKRLFAEYDENLKPVDKTKYQEMGSYIRYAEIMERAYNTTLKLPYLNVLLKVLDTLIACRDRLNQQQKSRLAWLIGQEKEHVQTLAYKRGVEI